MPCPAAEQAPRTMEETSIAPRSQGVSRDFLRADQVLDQPPTRVMPDHLSVLGARLVPVDARSGAWTNSSRVETYFWVDIDIQHA